MIVSLRSTALQIAFLSMLMSMATAQTLAKQVIKLRADQVTLKAVDAGRPDLVLQRADVSAANPLPITHENDDGSLTVEVKGKQYRVAGMDVVTNALRTAQSCIDKKTPKVGGTRGVQDPQPCM